MSIIEGILKTADDALEDKDISKLIDECFDRIESEISSAIEHCNNEYKNLEADIKSYEYEISLLQEEEDSDPQDIEENKKLLDDALVSQQEIESYCENMEKIKFNRIDLFNGLYNSIELEEISNEELIKVIFPNAMVGIGRHSIKETKEGAIIHKRMLFNFSTSLSHVDHYIGKVEDIGVKNMVTSKIHRYFATIGLLNNGSINLNISDEEEVQDELSGIIYEHIQEYIYAISSNFSNDYSTAQEHCDSVLSAIDDIERSKFNINNGAKLLVCKVWDNRDFDAEEINELIEKITTEMEKGYQFFSYFKSTSLTPSKKMKYCCYIVTKSDAEENFNFISKMLEKNDVDIKSHNENSIFSKKFCNHIAVYYNEEEIATRLEKLLKLYNMYECVFKYCLRLD